MASFVLTTGHDSATWAGESIAMTVGGATETWAFDAEIGGSISDGYNVARTFVSWANLGARAWTGATSFGYATTSFSATGRTSFTVTPTGTSPTCVISSGLQALLNWPANPTGTITPTAGALSSFDVSLRIKHLSPRSLGSGGMTTAGSFFTGPQAVARKRPSVSAICSEAEAFAVSEAFSVTANPRRFYTYDATFGGWLLFDAGKVTLSRKSRTFYTAKIEATQ